MSAIEIILPVYNVESYIEKCIQSIEDQIFKDFRLIVVDDCGTDNSMQLCRKKLESCKIDHLILQNGKNLGLSASRNKGILNSRAEFILFLDSDDWLHESALETMYRSALSNNADIVSCKAVQYWEYNNEFSEMITAKAGSYTSEKYLNLLLNGNTSAHICFRLFRRQLFNFIAFPTNVVFEDVLTMPVLIRQARNIMQVDDTLYYYLQRNSKTSITGSKPTNVAGFISCLKVLQAELAGENISDDRSFRKFAYKILFYLTYNLLHYSKKYTETKADLKSIQSFLKIRFLIGDTLVMMKSMKVNFILYLFLLKFSAQLLFFTHKNFFSKWFANS